jgi:hypothetical protein
VGDVVFAGLGAALGHQAGFDLVFHLGQWLGDGGAVFGDAGGHQGAAAHVHGFGVALFVGGL